MPVISVVTPCFNEEENIEELSRQVKDVFSKLPHYEYEHIFIDNASKDQTVKILKKLAENDKRIKIIVNARNFGHIRSPHHGLLQATGDAVIFLVADLQDPPSMIADFIKKWEEGYKVVMGVKTKSQESPLFFAARKAYYTAVRRIADVELVDNFYGFGLYDRKVIEVLRSIDDPYPYFRGMICEIGFEAFRIEYTQLNRKRGFTKNNFYTLYDMAMLGFTSHSKVPLRLATWTGFVLAFISLMIAVGYFIYKVLYWNRFEAGQGPVVIGLFFFSSVQLFFIGLLGEYIAAIQTRMLRRPLVVEKERINF